MTSNRPIDPKRAEEDPASAFASPQDVLADGSLTHEQKVRVLRRWKLDALEMDVATEEAMAGGEPSRLDEVIAALKALGADIEEKGTAPTKHGF